MYLSLKVIKEILKKNGYNNENAIFVSSEYSKTKSSGKLYKQVLHDLKVLPSSICHIGDNWNSDYKMAERMGFHAIHLPNTRDILKNGDGAIYSGAFFNNMFLNNAKYKNLRSPFSFLGIRCMLAVVANKLYDNPFVSVHPESTFGGDPYYLGYFALGMYLFAISSWILTLNRKNNISAIHFMARDGYMPMKAYRLLYGDIYPIKIDYLYLTRKAVLPLTINKKEDFWTLTNGINVLKNTPDSFLKCFNYIIPSQDLENFKKYCMNAGYVLDIPFASYKKYYKFMQMFIDRVYVQQYFDEYQSMMFDFLKSKFSNQKNATFDVGYSCRIESTLVHLYKFDITPYYVHINNDIAICRQKKEHMNLEIFYESSPSVTGFIREHLMSELHASCIGYRQESNETIPVFEEPILNYQTKFITDTIQCSAMEFINDMISHFGKDLLLSLPFRPTDACVPLEFVLGQSKPRDHVLFDATYFEDELGTGPGNSRLSLLWDWETYSTLPCDNDRQLLLADFPRWKRILFYALFDRNKLKTKTKEKLKNHPAILWAVKKSYQCVASICKRLRS